MAGGRQIIDFGDFQSNDPFTELALLFVIKVIFSDKSYLSDPPLVFDVGAHNGNFARGMMSFAPDNTDFVLFEADSRRVQALKRFQKLSGNQIKNVINKAVYRRSGDSLDFIRQDGESSHLAREPETDSLETPRSPKHWLDSKFDKIKKEKLDKVKVETIALDEFINQTGLSPDLIKIDVEGSEVHVIEGAKDYLKRKKVPVILEDNDLDASRLLADFGYRLINTHTLEHINFDEVDHFRGKNPDGFVINVIGFHPDASPKFSMPKIFSRVIFNGTLEQLQQSPGQENHLFTSQKFSSGYGLLKAKLDFRQEFTGSELALSYHLGDKKIGKYGGPSRVIANFYNQCAMHAPSREKMWISIECTEALEKGIIFLTISEMVIDPELER